MDEHSTPMSNIAPTCAVEDGRLVGVDFLVDEVDNTWRSHCGVKTREALVSLKECSENDKSFNYRVIRNI